MCDKTYIRDAPSNDYLKVSNTQSDHLISRDRFRFADCPWSLHNKLPLKIIVVSSRGNIIINPNAVVKKPATFFRDQDTIIIYYGKIAECNRLFDEHTVRDHLKNVIIGGVAYEFGEGQRQYSNSYNPISGVKIHNHFTFPLRVYSNRDATAVTLTADDGMGAMGGSGSVYYNDNNHRGFKIGDVLYFGLVVGTKIVHNFNVVLKDTHISDVHVGVVDNSCADPTKKYADQFCDVDIPYGSLTRGLGVKTSTCESPFTSYETNLVSDDEAQWPDIVEYNANRYQIVTMPYYYPISPGVSHQIYGGR
jgi:hypothetical protein